MSQVTAFIKKEFTEMTRTGKWTILIILFVLFGIMNPAIAKLTPWMMKSMSAELEKQGMTITETVVTAMTSWEQYFKNVSMELIIIAALLCGILTSEYQRGTLVIMLTKGLNRYKVILVKTIHLFFVWTVCYWLCFGITYTYNAYFWDNSIASNIFLAALFIYVLGLCMLSIMVLASTICLSGGVVLLITAAAAIMSNLLGMLPVVGKYLPTRLMSAGSLLTGETGISDFVPSLIVTVVIIILAELLSIVVFSKKRI